MMVWVKFILAAAVIVFAANYLAKYGDIIAVRTKLGGMFIGILLLAGATSLPELLTSASAISQGTPNLAAGNLLGSNSFNMLLLAVIDMIYRKKRVLRNAALKHALTGSLAIVLIGVVMFFILAKIDFAIGWVGIDSLFIIAFYIFAVWLIQKNSSVTVVQQPVDEGDANKNSLLKGIIGFLAAAAVLVLITPVMVRNANEIAIITGLGTTFIGTTLVAIVTSLPELVTTLAAVKIGAEDMAIGNLFGSNMFNMFAIGLTDLFYTQGNFLSAISPDFLLVAITGLVMTGFGLIGNLAKLEKRILFVELDALALVLFYILSTWLLYVRS
jgi:cation:H+ antiporter